MTTHSLSEIARRENDLWWVRRLTIPITALWLVSLIVPAILHPQPYATLWQSVFGQLVAGRIFGVSMGLRNDYHVLMIVNQAAIQDVVCLLVLYPLLIAGYRKAVRWNVVGPVISNIRDKAERNRKRIKPFGAIGLVVLVFIPAWSTGVVPAGIVGHLIGLSVPTTLVAVTIGNAIAVLAWVVFFDFMRDLSEQVADMAPMIILVAAIVSAIILQVLHLRRMWRKRRALQRARREEQRAEARGESL